MSIYVDKFRETEDVLFPESKRRKQMTQANLEMVLTKKITGACSSQTPGQMVDVNDDMLRLSGTQNEAPDHTALSGRVAFDCRTVLSDNSCSASCATSLLRVCSNRTTSSYMIFPTMSIGFLYFACILEYEKSRSISASADTISPDSPNGA